MLLVSRGSRFHGLTPEGDRTLEWGPADRGRCAGNAGGPARHAGAVAGAAAAGGGAVGAARRRRVDDPYRALHPNVTFSVLSRTSDDIFGLLDDLQIEAGLTYLPQGEASARHRMLPLYQERYCLAIAAAAASGFGDTVGSAEMGQVPLCLLTPDMQNRRIVEARLRAAGSWSDATLETNSIIVLMSHVRTGHWASVLSLGLADAFGLPAGIRLIPIEETGPVPTIGLLYPQRDPVAPLTAALLALAPTISYKAATSALLATSLPNRRYSGHRQR